MGLASAISRQRRKRASKAAAEAANPITNGPSPNPMTNLVLTDILLRGGGRLLRQAVERTLLEQRHSDDTARKVVDDRSLRQTLIGAALARVATRSVPGALIVGGGMLAKTLYDHAKGQRQAKAEGSAEIARQADKAR